MMLENLGGFSILSRFSYPVRTIKAKFFLDSTTFSNVEPKFLGSRTRNEKLAVRPCEIVIFAQLGGWRFLLEALTCLYPSKTIQNEKFS